MASVHFFERKKELTRMARPEGVNSRHRPPPLDAISRRSDAPAVRWGLAVVRSEWEKPAMIVLGREPERRTFIGLAESEELGDI